MLDRLVPASQRRTLEELTAELDLRHGDRAAKMSAFWTMLALSAVIASAGVLADSTATVIGAMIIAPLSTPIMGIALGIVKRQRTGAVWIVLAGTVVVVAIGLAFSAVVPGSYQLLDNTQISGRTSPTLLDVAAASATGLAGAIALARRDVGAVLPGVAIAISLVPPLAVVGVCLGFGERGLALGATLLFASNLLALVLAGTLVFAVLGYSAEERRATLRASRRSYVTLGVLLTLVLLPLGLNTLVAYVLSSWHGRIESVAKEWIAETPGASVTSVDNSSTTFVVHVQTAGGLPPTGELLADLAGEVPAGLPIVVETTLGRRIRVGTVGEAAGR